MTINKQVVKKAIKYSSILIILIPIICIFIFIKNNPVKEELNTVRSLAENYYKINNNYGLITNESSKSNCFNQKSFLRDKKMDDIFLSGKIENISCRFDVENSLATKWSVSFVVKGKVYCTDSKNVTRETPGITISTSCNE